MNLARSGFKYLKLVDFDKVELSNLNRQFYFNDQIGMAKTKALSANLKRINPGIKTDDICVRIEEENIIDLFSDCDIVVEALDEAMSKRMFVSRLLPLKELIVSVSGISGIGDSDKLGVHWPKDNLAIVGDLTTDVKDVYPSSSSVNIAAAKQADIVLYYIINTKR